MKKVLVNKELLQQVLEVLEAADNRDGAYSCRCEIDALRTLLDAPAVEPVVGALQIQLFSGEWVDCSQDTFDHYRKTGRKARALYTAPQSRKAVKLTRDELAAMCDQAVSYYQLGRVAEAAFMAKNGLES